jgi:hypothetical protein
MGGEAGAPEIDPHAAGHGRPSPVRRGGDRSTGRTWRIRGPSRAGPSSARRNWHRPDRRRSRPPVGGAGSGRVKAARCRGPRGPRSGQERAVPPCGRGARRLRALKALTAAASEHGLCAGTSTEVGSPAPPPALRGRRSAPRPPPDGEGARCLATAAPPPPPPPRGGAPQGPAVTAAQAPRRSRDGTAPGPRQRHALPVCRVPGRGTLYRETLGTRRPHAGARRPVRPAAPRRRAPAGPPARRGRRRAHALRAAGRAAAAAPRAAAGPRRGARPRATAAADCAGFRRACAAHHGGAVDPPRPHTHAHTPSIQDTLSSSE